MSTKLRLARIPKAKQVEITISVSVHFKETVDLYGELDADASGEKNDVDRLIPYVLEPCLCSDLAFRRAAWDHQETGTRR